MLDYQQGHASDLHRLLKKNATQKSPQAHGPDAILFVPSPTASKGSHVRLLYKWRGLQKPVRHFDEGTMVQKRSRHTTTTHCRITARSLFLAGVASGALTGQIAFADNDTIETVVVRAPHYVPADTDAGTKLGVPLIETPQSLSVVTRDQVDLLDMQNLGQAVRYTAGVVGENYGADQRYDYLTMRGFTPIQYVDGLQAPIGSISSIGVDLYGFDSVQMLKGPASALYGLATPGGIVNLTSRRPQAEASGSAQVQIGTYNNYEIAGDVTGTLWGESTVTGRLTAIYRNNDTQTYGVKVERFYIAPALSWNITTSSNLTFLSYYQYDDVHGDGNGFLPAYGVLFDNPHGKVPTSTNLGDIKYNDYRRNQAGIGYDFHHDFNDWLTLEQNTKYFYNRYVMLDIYGTGLLDANADGVPDDYRTVARSNFPFREDIRSLNADTRISAHFETAGLQHALLAGIDLRHYTNHSDYGFSSAPPIDLYNPQYGMDITTPPWISYTRERQDQSGVYLEDQIKYGHWILTLGGRHDWVNTKNYNTINDDKVFTYRAGLNYKFDSGLSPYISYATSFQPTAGTDYSGSLFKPSKGNQVELGLKFEPIFLPENVKALTTLALYDLNQDNVKTDDPAHTFFYLQTGAVEVKGVEWEGITRINDQITINASYTYTDSRVTRSNGADLGKLMPMMPVHKASLFADYTEQRGLFAGFGAGLGMRYTSASYGDSANAYRTPPLTQWDALIHYDVKQWRLQLNASNLFDKTYISRCSSTSQCFYGSRRNVLFTVTRKF